MLIDNFEADLEIIGKIERYWTCERCLDETRGIDQSDKTVGDLCELYEQEGVSNMVEYLRDNFDPKEPLATHHYTCREMLDQMRECTPIGIMVYSVLAATPEVFDE